MKLEKELEIFQWYLMIKVMTKVKINNISNTLSLETSYLHLIKIK